MDNLAPKEIADEEMINQSFHELLNDYLNTKHRKKVEIITKAFNFANQAHKGIKRRSGEPYIMHPIAVASIVCNEIGLGSTSICAALLHDVVEDTDYTVEDIENIFGPKIAQIVDGLTKISGGIFGDRASAQACVPLVPCYPTSNIRLQAKRFTSMLHLPTAWGFIR